MLGKYARGWKKVNSAKTDWVLTFAFGACGIVIGWWLAWIMWWAI